MSYNEYSEPLDVQSIKDELNHVSGDAITILMQSGKAEDSCRELPKQSQKEQLTLSRKQLRSVWDELEENFDIVRFYRARELDKELMDDTRMVGHIGTIIARRKNNEKT